MTSPNNQPFIVIGDKTSHGGTVVGGATTSTTFGKQIARVGDPVTCPQCGHPTTIATGDDTMIVMGRAVARHGNKTACGATLIASQSVTTGTPARGSGTASSSAQALDPASAADVAAPATITPLDGVPDLAATSPKVLVTLRIGMFFDGTANNVSNTRIGAQCRAEAKDKHEEAVLLAGCQNINNTSYGDSPTNVYKLFTLYKNTAQNDVPITHGGDYFIPIYIEGDGTFSGQGDSSLGLSTAGGDGGMLQRVEDAFYVSLKFALDLFTEKHPDAYAQAIELDIFGFSRGSAEARHFLHEVNQRGQGPLGDVIPRANLKLKPGFAWKTDLRAGFVGLFDTVAHLGVEPDTDEAEMAWRGLYEHLPAGCSSRGVVHLTARDECRVNFPLTSAAPPYQDIPMPGVHSDIGGGYLDNAVETAWLIRPIIARENAMRPLDSSRAYRAAAQQLKRLQAHDPDNAASMSVYCWAVSDADELMPESRLGVRMQTVAATVQMQRTLSNGYAGIPLRAMHLLAKKAGVPFEEIDDNDPAFKMPDELWSVQASALSYVQMGRPPHLSPEQERMLRQRYLHHSADWHITGPSWLPPMTFLYVNRPTDDGHRVVIPNKDKS